MSLKLALVCLTHFAYTLAAPLEEKAEERSKFFDPSRQLINYFCQKTQKIEIMTENAKIEYRFMIDTISNFLTYFCKEILKIDKF